jgi:hypothetical protein
MSIPRIKHLVILPCHGINIQPKKPLAFNYWVTDYTYPEQAVIYYSQLLNTSNLIFLNENSVACISGGYTRENVLQLSEAESYYNILKMGNWFGMPEVADRILLDTNATDSLGNVVFSIAAFYDKYGYYPEELTIVGFPFKERRFRQHCLSIGWKKEINYIHSMNPPLCILNEALTGEAAKLKSMQQDLYLKGDAWKAQRAKRNPYGKTLKNYNCTQDFQLLINYLYNDDDLDLILPNF